MDRLMLRPSRAAMRYDVSIATLRYMVDEGIIAGDRTPGGHRRINRESADDYFTRSDRQADLIVESLGL